MEWVKYLNAEPDSTDAFVGGIIAPGAGLEGGTGNQHHQAPDAGGTGSRQGLGQAAGAGLRRLTSIRRRASGCCNRRVTTRRRWPECTASPGGRWASGGRGSKCRPGPYWPSGPVPSSAGVAAAPDSGRRANIGNPRSRRATAARRAWDSDAAGHGAGLEGCAAMSAFYRRQCSSRSQAGWKPFRIPCAVAGSPAALPLQ